jgi:hypothetical protein
MEHGRFCALALVQLCGIPIWNNDFVCGCRTTHRTRSAIAHVPSNSPSRIIVVKAAAKFYRSTNLPQIK